MISLERYCYHKILCHLTGTGFVEFIERENTDSFVAVPHYRAHPLFLLNYVRQYACTHHTTNV